MVLKSQISRISIALAILMLIPSLIVTSPSLRFVLSALVAVLSVLPVICGPMRYRLVGIIAVAAGIGLALPLYPAFKGDPYYVKAKVVQAAAFGMEVARAADKVAVEYNRTPLSLRELGLDLPKGAVADVSFPKDGTILLVLEVPTLSGSILQYTPTGTPGARQWRCSSQAIPPALLPVQCRESVNARP
ncbi:MAG: hypothetical protein HPY65_04105 [Syntrophaceae bacterium]|nr:hypothetical protein [Syntrophaceae bacterium]